MKTSCKFAAHAFCLVISFSISGCGGGSNSSGGGSAPAPIPVPVPVPAALTVTSISPAAIAAGGPAATLTVNGTGFTTATTVQVNGTAEPTVYVSSTQIMAAVAAGQLANGALLTVMAANGTATSSSATPVTLEVDNPVPAISQVAPNSLTTGMGAMAIMVTGTGFVPSTVVQVAGAARTTTYVSATQLTVQLTSADAAAAGSFSLTAVNSTPMGGSSAAAAIAVNNPAPGGAIAIAPNFVATGATGVTITVTGTGFVPASVVQVGMSTRATTYVGATQLTFQLTAADRVNAGSLLVSVVNPAPGGGTSGTATIAVNNPGPGGTITLAPNVVATGTTAATITVTGTGFVPASVVQVGASGRATTYVSATQLTFQLTATDVANAGSLAVSVVTPAPGGGTSGTAAVTITAPIGRPVITSVSPASFVAGSSDSVLYVLGSSSYSGTTISANPVSGTVLWNGTALNTQLNVGFNGGIYAYFFQATVPAALLATAGTATVTVTVPTANPPLSNALSVAIVNSPAPTLTSISPNCGPIHTATAVTLYGTGFAANTTVGFNGTNLAVTSYTSTSLTVTLPVSSVVLPGNGLFTVTTPAPGGGTTAGLTYTAYVGLVNNSMVYNPVNGLFYVSVPSSAGVPYGNSVVSVDPATGSLGTPIYVGSEPNKLAITSDGRYLWVGLDGAAAVRKVDLTAGVAGLQFSAGGNNNVYQNPETVLALAALPGATDSVVVSAASVTNAVSDLTVAIFDSGVMRGTALQTSNPSGATYSLLVDGTRGEVYVGSQSSYNTYTYGATGLTPKAFSFTGMYATASADEMQIAGGKLYTDFGEVYDSEPGSLLGTLYSSGATQAVGPTTADTALNEIFVLDNSTNFYGTYNQVQVFDPTTYNLISTAAIPVNIANSGYSTNSNPSRLSRWGTNGLAFRTSTGVYSLRSNLVKNLSGVSADLGVAVTASGSNVTGANSTYVATITNAGPSAATNVTLTGFIPSTGTLVSVTPSAGTCSTVNGVACDLGGLANGASATVTLVVTQTTAGAAPLTVAVAGSENDANTANNQATSTLMIAGNAYSLTPSLTAISPASVITGTGDTTLTVIGTGFTTGSTVQLNGVALVTSYVSGVSLTATVPAANLATLGWAPVTVKTPTPGGGVSGSLPLAVYSVLTLGVNHILYDPFSRKIMASVGSGSSTVAGDSIVSITPETATVGTPVSIGSQPTNLSLTSDGQILYTILSGSQSVARYNMLTQAADFTYPVPTASTFVGNLALRGIAAQPGTEDTIALDLGSNNGNAIYDFNPTTRTAAIRGQATGRNTGSCIQFLDAGNLFAFDTDTYLATLDHYPVTSAGFTFGNYSQYAASTLQHFGCFKLSGGLAFSMNDGVANPVPNPAVQLGYFNLPSSFATFGGDNVEPDASLQRTFFVVNSGLNASAIVDSVEAFDNTTYLPATLIPVEFTATEGSGSFYTVTDLVRWGQDGLAVLTSGGHIYLLRGAAVVPQLAQTNTAAMLTASSATTVAHGAGNTLLTLTGSDFVPGVAVTWNGGYRTTTIVDPTHVTVAIPASDLMAAGTGSLVATNPGAPASSALSVTVQ